MPATFEKIATSTLTSAASSITFTNIDQTYTDLEIHLEVKAASSPGQHVYFRCGNNSYDSSSSYGNQALYARGAPAAAFSGDWNNSLLSNWYLPYNSYISSAANKFSQQIVYIFNYSATNTKKPLRYLSNTITGNSNEYASIETGQSLWNSTSAINQIQFYHSNPSTNLDVGCVITIYGIKKA